MPAKRENIIKSGKRTAAIYSQSFRPLRLLRKYLGVIALAFSILLIPAGSTLLSPVASYSTIPTFEILTVTADQSLTIRTHNFPANQTFKATMGPMGTKGVNGIEVGNINSGAGGTFEATFPVPAALVGSYQIAIRLQTSHLYPYYSFNWFYNNTSGSNGTGGIPGYTGIPTFKITNVVKDTSVTIETNNFPANQDFTATMGVIGTRGIGGIVVGSFNSDNGGTITQQFNIPAALQGMGTIAIRTQTSHLYPYYAFNYFYNTDGNVPPPGGSGQGGVPYTGIPTISITSIIRNVEVTFQTHNYPANQVFQVTMGPIGTRGINGTAVGQFPSGNGGSFPVTVPIPASLADANQISIRAQTSHLNPFFSYNYFFNTTTP